MRGARRGVEEEQLGRADDRCQHVVEVVRHAAGQPPDGLELLRQQQPFLEPPALVAHRGVLHGPADRRRQPLQAVLHEVVGGAGPHHGDGGILSDAAGHHDERDVHRVLLQQREGGGGVEVGHRVIAEHHVPRLPCERLPHRLRGLDTLV